LLESCRRLPGGSYQPLSRPRCLIGSRRTFLPPHSDHDCPGFIVAERGIGMTNRCVYAPSTLQVFLAVQKFLVVGRCFSSHHSRLLSLPCANLVFGRSE